MVVDDEEGLSGIFTAKDLAYRVSGVSRSAASALIPFSGYRRRLRSPYYSREPNNDEESHGYPGRNKCDRGLAAHG